MKRLFAEWQRNVDSVALNAASSAVGWVVLSVVALVMMLAASAVPVARDLFQLELGPALAFAAPPFLLGIVLGVLRRYRKVSQVAFEVLALASGVLLKLFGGALVVYSSGPGAALMAAPLIFTAAYHGHLYRATLRNPLELILCAAVLAMVVAMAPDPLHVSIFAVVVPAAFGGSLVLGKLAMDAREEREHIAGLRAAVDAQILAERTQRADELSGTVVSLMQANHDANNVLQAALASAELLPDDGGEAASRGRLRRILERLRLLLKEAQQIGAARGQPFVETERVGLLAPIEEILGAQALRFPDVEFVKELPEKENDNEDIYVDFCGGESGVQRVLENLLVNAAQGNGVDAASHVSLCVELEENVGALRIAVRDDGPGFPADVLERPITGFESGKPGGMGLGLYTVERLVRASGGSVSRANCAPHGAEVSIFLQGGFGR